ncbi:MAG: hypothetical protein WA996_11090 [Candidatus Promineifilaceae bacterium]
MNIQRLFTLLFIVSLFTMAVRETRDADMWWHLRTGEVIVDEGIPRQDIFSYTVPSNEWITHEWLSQVLMWMTYLWSGFTGLMLLFAAFTTAALALVFARCDGRPYLAAFVVLLAALASAPFWGVRPQVFNMLFAALFVFLVEGYKDGKVQRRTLWLLPLLTIIWANLHSGYLLGIALLASYILGEGFQLRFGTRAARGLDRDGIRWLAFMTVACFLAAVINPNGPELWIYPFFTLGSGAMQQYIQEWQSPNFHLNIFWPFAALLGIGVVSFIISRKRTAWTDIILFISTGAAGLLSARHIPLFAVVASPIIARYLLVSLEGSRLYPILSGQSTAQMTGRLQLLNWLLLVIVVVVATSWVFSKAKQNDLAIAEQFPVSAVDYLEASGLDEQRGYNSYNWGGYMIWRGIPVFVDGRADVYGDEFLHFYRRTFDLTSRWREPLNEYEVDYVLMESTHSLFSLLAASDEWKQAYGDEVAAVYIRAER